MNAIKIIVCVEITNRPVDLVLQWWRIHFGCKRPRVQSPAPASVFMFVCFLYCCCCVFTFLSKNTLFIAKYCNSFYNVNLFSILNVLQDLWPIIRVKRYRPSIFKTGFEVHWSLVSWLSHLILHLSVLSAVTLANLWLLL